MRQALQSTDHLEGELTPEPVMGPAMGSVALHACVGAGLVLYGILGGFFHHNLWGNAAAGGAIQVSLVSNAIPLPSNQPPNQNVLSTETPSEAPAPPTPKTKQTVDESAIPILGKQKKKEQKTERQTPPRKVDQTPANRAYYGEQSGSSMPHATQSQLSVNGPTTVNNGNFGSLFGWYVDGITRKMGQNWYKSLVDPGTPKGTRSYINFKIYRDGSVGDVQLERASGSPTLDRSCMQAAMRSGNFGSLPTGYNQSTLMVSYYCEY
ncbi:MAG TPA: TonB C-terminal domain-containing protein [Terracidiphilus sp.]|nr:TonB C-terminal domain-containing protein [Terracidiphilus sp.]